MQEPLLLELEALRLELPFETKRIVLQVLAAAQRVVVQDRSAALERSQPLPLLDFQLLLLEALLRAQPVDSVPIRGDDLRAAGTQPLMAQLEIERILLLFELEVMAVARASGGRAEQRHAQEQHEKNSRARIHGQ